MTRVGSWKALAVTSAVLAASVLALLPGTGLGGGSKLKGASFNIGFETFEPTLGATANGDLYFSTTPESGVAIGWKASIAKSTDGGKKWEDVGPQLPTGHSVPPETNDPYIYVDPGTGRVFTFHMGPILTCSITSYSDDGGETWNQNPVGCGPTGVWDHQTMVAAKPRNFSTIGYPNVLHQCVNAVYAAMCSRSIDGGLSWQPSVPVHINEGPVETGSTCGAQHGHLAAAPDGTVYLPSSVCATKPVVFISKDDGVTWTKSVIAEVKIPFVDPSVSVDSKGNVYATFIDESGWLYFSASTDGGQTWDKYQRIHKTPVTAQMPVIVAGDPGKIVIAYPSTDDLPKGFKTKGYTSNPPDPLVVKDVEWSANFTVSYNALDVKPTFETIVASGSDPIGRGRICTTATRCAYLIDFIEAVIGPDGRPYASFVDGCIDECAVSAEGPQIQGTGLGLMTTLVSGPRLCEKRCWRYKSSFDGVDLLDALEFQMSAQQMQESLAHTVEALTPEQQRMRREAAVSRLRAVFQLR